MSTQLKFAEVEAALIALVLEDLSSHNPDVRAITPKDIDADGNLIINVSRPTVLIVFETAGYASFGDNVRTSYAASSTWAALCFDQSLRSPADERAETFALTSKVVELIAGQRLTLDDGNVTEPMLLAGAELFQFNANGTWYAVRFQVSDSVQFSDKS